MRASHDELAAVVSGTHHNPHAVLGPHPRPGPGTPEGPDSTTAGDPSATSGSVTVRVMRPLADAVVVRTRDGDVAAEHVHDGVWVAELERDDVPDYRLLVTYGDSTTRADDPYRFLPTVGELDLHLISEGRHEQLWTVLGANPRSY